MQARDDFLSPWPKASEPRDVACAESVSPDTTPPELVPLCDTFHTAGVLRLGRWVRKLQKSGARKAIVVGRVDKGRMHDPLRLFRQIPDLRAALIWYRHLRHDKRSSVVLGALADELERGGITLIDSTTYIPEHMATSGVMTRANADSSRSR